MVFGERDFEEVFFLVSFLDGGVCNFWVIDKGLCDMVL